MHEELKQQAYGHGQSPNPISKSSLGRTSILIAAIALILNVFATPFVLALLPDLSINLGELPSYLQKSAFVIAVIVVVWIRLLAYPFAVAIAAMGISERGGNPFSARIGATLAVAAHYLDVFVVASVAKMIVAVVLIAATVIALRHNQSRVQVPDADKIKELAPSRIGKAVVLASLLFLFLETFMSLFLTAFGLLNLYDPFEVSFGDVPLLRVPPIELMALLVSGIAIVGFWQAGRTTFYLGFGTSLVLLVPRSSLSLIAICRGITPFLVFAAVWLVVLLVLVIHRIWSIQLRAETTSE